MDQFFESENPALAIVIVLIGITIASFAVWYTSPHYSNSTFEMPNIYPEPTYPNYDQDIAQQMLHQRLLDRLRDELAPLSELRDVIAALRQTRDSGQPPPNQQSEINALRRQLAALQRRFSSRPPFRTPLAGPEIERSEQDFQPLLQQAGRRLPHESLAPNANQARTQGLHRRPAAQHLRAQTRRHGVAPVANGNSTTPEPSSRLADILRTSSLIESRHSNAAMRQSMQPDSPAQTRRGPIPDRDLHGFRGIDDNDRRTLVPRSTLRRPQVQAPTPRTAHRRGVHLPNDLSEYFDTLTAEENAQLLSLFRSTARSYYENTVVADIGDSVELLAREVEAIVVLYVPLARELMRDLRASLIPAKSTVAEEAEVNDAADDPIPELNTNGASVGSVSSTASDLVAEGSLPRSSSGGSQKSNESTWVEVSDLIPREGKDIVQVHESDGFPKGYTVLVQK